MLWATIPWLDQDRQSKDQPTTPFKKFNALRPPFLGLDQDDLGRKFEIKTDFSKISVKGRLRKSLMHWQQINAPQFVSETIEFDYKLPQSTDNTATENI